MDRGRLIACGIAALGACVLVLLIGTSSAAPSSCARDDGYDESAPIAAEFSDAERKQLLKHAPLGPPPADPTNSWSDDPRAALFGQALFFDGGLSANGKVSCASCHRPDRGFTDDLQVAEGLGVGRRRTPRLVNLAWQDWFNRDGSADSLWAQAARPLEDAREMGGDRLALAHHLAGDAELRAAYETLFGALPELDDDARFPAHARPAVFGRHLLDQATDADPLAVSWQSMSLEDRDAIDRVLSNAMKAIAAYERLLVSKDSAFDRFAEGLRTNDNELLGALSPEARAGARLFVGRAGCARCHVGPNFSDGEFHALGLLDRHGKRPTDAARYDGVPRLLADPLRTDGPYSDAPESDRARLLGHLTRASESWGEFQTPSLRSLGIGPFMHQGQLAELGAVVHFYSTLEGRAPLHRHAETLLVPLLLSELEQASLVAFLRSLEGAPLSSSLLQAPASLLRADD